MSIGGTTSFGTDGGGMISVDDATGGVTQDGASLDMAVPGTDISTSNINTYAVLAEQARQEAARQEYEQQQALAADLQAGLLAEQARGTQPAMGFTPDGAMADEAIRSQQAAEFDALRAAEDGRLYSHPLIDLPIMRSFGPTMIRNAAGRPMPFGTMVSNLPFGIGTAARGFLTGDLPFGLVGNNEFGDFPGDAVSPSLPETPPAPPVTPVADDVPDVVVAPTPSQVFANSQAFYRPTLLDQAPAGMPGFDAANRQFNLSSALRPDIYNNYDRDLLGRQGYVPL